MALNKINKIRRKTSKNENKLFSYVQTVKKKIEKYVEPSRNVRRQLDIKTTTKKINNAQ